jgi:hypothetical protein
MEIEKIEQVVEGLLSEIFPEGQGCNQKRIKLGPGEVLETGLILNPSDYDLSIIVISGSGDIYLNCDLHLNNHIPALSRWVFFQPHMFDEDRTYFVKNHKEEICDFLVLRIKKAT